MNGLGALPTPPDQLARAWPVRLALAELPTAAPAKFHSPKCQPVTLNQGAFGACVAYSGAYIQASQELADEGRQLLPGVLDPLHAYALVKGLPWPLTSLSQDPSPGLNPPQLWDYTKRVGWPTKDGSPRRVDAAYYSLGRPSSDAAWLAAVQQTILQLGPFQMTSSWPDNWWNTDAAGFMPTPSSTLAGGHAYESCGWDLHADGSWDLICHQTWGAFGHDPEHPDHFRVRAAWLDPLGWEAWKVIDLVDAPTPPLEVGMLPVYSIDPKFVDLAVGVQCFREDGKTPLVKVSSGGAGRFSPGYAYLGKRAVEINTGGVRQYAVVNAADCSNVRPYAPGKSHSVSVTLDGQPAASRSITY